jgi:hypothetical protein
MRFESSERVYTDLGENEVMDDILRHFKRIAEAAKVSDTEIVVTDSEAAFGAIIRKDKTTISLTRIINGYSVAADVRYGPSFLFWVFVAIGLIFGAGAGSLIPIGFYFWHKNIVRNAVGATLRRISDDFSNTLPREAYKAPRATNATDELLKLAELRERGYLTDEEFASRKMQILQNR